MTSQYPGNDLQTEAVQNRVFWCPENPLLEADSYLTFLLHIQPSYQGILVTPSGQVLRHLDAL